MDPLDLTGQDTTNKDQGTRWKKEGLPVGCAPGASGENQNQNAPKERLTICGGVQGQGGKGGERKSKFADIRKPDRVTTRVTAITGKRTIGRNVPG
jgi:hypothetical protein